MASTASGDLAVLSNEQNVEVAIKTITSVTLIGVFIVYHWEHPYRNELFSVARFNLELFKNNLENYKDLNEAVLQAFRERVDRLHKELESEILKKEALRYC